MGYCGHKVPIIPKGINYFDGDRMGAVSPVADGFEGAVSAGKVGLPVVVEGLPWSPVKINHPKINES